MEALLPLYFDFLCPLILGATLLSCAKLVFSKPAQIRFSSIMLAILALVFLIPAWNRYIWVSKLPTLFLFGEAFGNSYWLIGPLFYLFVLHNTHVTRPQWRDLAHLLPYSLIVVLATLKAFTVSFSIVLVVWNLLTSMYVALSLQCLLKARRQRDQHVSQGLSPVFRWCLLLVFGVFAFIVADILIAGFLILNIEVQQWVFVAFEYIRLMVVLLLICFVQFSGLQLHNPANDFDEPSEKPAKQAESRLSDSSASALQKTLEQSMSEHCLFKQADLSLTKLSESLGVSSHYLSDLLNSHMKVSFYEYINQLRIDDAKMQLLDRPEKAIVDVAINSGFNSKSTFYNCFKKHCGMTPTQYRSQLMKGISSPLSSKLAHEQKVNLCDKAEHVF